MSAATLYDDLSVAPDADLTTIKRAYRSRALEHHPDRTGGHDATERMARINHAWRVLSDPEARARYDRSIRVVPRTPSPFTPSPSTPSSASRPPTSQSPPPGAAWPDGASSRSRKDAWFAGIRVQAARLTAQAGRSAALALSLKRRGRLRSAYEAELDAIVTAVSADIPERVRHARSAGAAPLDLALASALVGLQVLARQLGRHALATELPPRVVIQAELVDRIWDTLAHELAHEVETALGGNPHVSRRLLLR